MSVAAQTLSPPSRTLMFLEGRAISELGAFLGALPLLSLAPKGDGHPVLVLPGLVAADTSTRPLRSFLKGRGYAVSRLAPGPQSRTAPWRAERDGRSGAGVERHARPQGLAGRLEPRRPLRTPARQDDAGARALRDHARQPVCNRPEGDQRLARLRDGERPPRRRRGRPFRRRAVGDAAGADHRDLQPHRRRLRLAGLHGKDLGDIREHRSREQPLRHGPSSRRGLCGRRSPGAA